MRWAARERRAAGAEGGGGDGVGAAAAFGERGFGLADELDHAVVAFLRSGTEGEDAVLHEDEAFQFRPVGVLCEFADGFAEDESGHDVRDDDDAVAPGLLHEFKAVRLIGDRDNGVGMRVVHEFPGMTAWTTASMLGVGKSG